MVTAPKLYRLNVDQYDAMIKAGVFREGAHVELLDGELIEMSPQHEPHIGCVRRLNGLVHAAGVEPGTVLVQLPLYLNRKSEPEPDLVLLRPPAQQYDRRRAKPGDVLLLIEVSDSSRLYDRDRKVPRYAKAGIPEVWLVDLVDEVVRIYRQPESGVYQLQATAARAEMVTAELFPSLSVEVDQILPPLDIA